MRYGDFFRALFEGVTGASRRRDFSHFDLAKELYAAANTHVGRRLKNAQNAQNAETDHKNWVAGKSATYMREFLINPFDDVEVYSYINSRVMYPQLLRSKLEAADCSFDISSADTNLLFWLTMCQFKKILGLPYSVIPVDSNTMRPVHINSVFIKEAQANDNEISEARRLFYKVTSNFKHISKIVCNDEDVVDETAVEVAMAQINSIETKTLFIIGEGGIGKTTLMFRLARESAEGISPKSVFWVDLKDLSSSNDDTPAQSVVRYMKTITGGFQNETILFIESPSESKDFLLEIQEYQEKNPLFKVVLAERNHLIKGFLHGEKENFEFWIDSSRFLCLSPDGNTKQFDWAKENERINQNGRIFEHRVSTRWKTDVVKKVIEVISEHRNESNSRLQSVFAQFNAKELTTSIADLIYNLLFSYNKQFALAYGKHIDMDWDEWEKAVRNEFGNSAKRNTFKYLATLGLFNVPMTTTVLSRILGYDEIEVNDFVRNRFWATGEPVIVREDTKEGKVFLHLKHDTVAKRFFDFAEHPRVMECLRHLIPLMDRETARSFEKLSLSKRNVLQKGKKLLPFDVTAEGIINTINSYGDVFLKHLKGNKKDACRIYSFDLAQFWLEIDKFQKMPFDERNFEKLGSLAGDLQTMHLVNSRVLNELAFYYDDHHKLGFHNKKKAKEILEFSLAENSKDVVVFRMTEGFYLRNDMQYEATKIFDAFLDRNKNDVKILNELAKQYTQNNLRERALKVSLFVLDIDSSNLQALKGLAYLYAKGRDFSKAEKYFMLALKEDPDNLLFYCGLARTYRGMGISTENKEERIALFNKAVFKLESALNVEPNHLPSLNALANIYVRMGEDLGAKFYQKATDILIRILDENPRDPEARVGLGRLYSRTGFYDEAEKILKQCHPRSIIELTELAKLYVTWGFRSGCEDKLEMAEQVFERILSIRPTDRFGLTEFASFYQRTGNTKKAEETFERAFEAHPYDDVISIEFARFYKAQSRTASKKNNEKLEKRLLRKSILQFEHSLEVIRRVDTILFNELAGLYEKDSRFNDAKSLYLQVLDVDKKCPLAHSGLARIYGRSEPDYDKAIIHFNEAMKYERGNKSVLRNDFAKLQENAGNLDEAKSLFQETFDSNENDRKAVDVATGGLVRVYVKLGFFEEAEDVVNQALFSNPHDTIKLNELAKTYGEMGRFSEAHKTFLRSLEISEKDAYALYGLGVTLLEMDDYKNAFVTFNKLRQFHPKSPFALRGLALIYTKRKQFDKLAGIYNQMRRIKGHYHEAMCGYFDLYCFTQKYCAAIKLLDRHRSLFKETAFLQNALTPKLQEKLAKTIECLDEKRRFHKLCFESGVLGSLFGKHIAKIEMQFGNIGNYGVFSARAVLQKVCIEQGGDIHAWLSWLKLEQENGNIGELTNPAQFSARWILREMYDKFTGHPYAAIAWVKLEQRQNNIGGFDEPEEGSARWILHKNLSEKGFVSSVWVNWIKLEHEHGCKGKLDEPEEYSARWLLRELCLEQNSDDTGSWVTWAKLELEESEIGNIDNPTEFSARWIMRKAHYGELRSSDIVIFWATLEKENENEGDFNEPTRYSARWILRQSCIEGNGDSSVWRSWIKLEREFGNFGSENEEFSANWIRKEATRRFPNVSPEWWWPLLSNDNTDRYDLGN